MRVAGAEARATALESAAATFRESGSDARAKEFEEEAAAIRKKEAHAPPPGCRLDMATGFVVRAERRALRADDAVKIAEKALAEAVETRDAAHKEVEDAKAQLTKIRADLAAGPVDPESAAVAATAAAADAQAIAVGAQASDALARARTALQSTEWTPLTLRVFQLPEDLGHAVFAGRAAPALDAPLDAPTSFLIQDRLQSRIREAALASARAATAAASVPTAVAPAPDAGAPAQAP